MKKINKQILLSVFIISVIASQAVVFYNLPCMNQYFLNISLLPLFGYGAYTCSILFPTYLILRLMHKNTRLLPYISCICASSLVLQFCIKDLNQRLFYPGGITGFVFMMWITNYIIQCIIVGCISFAIASVLIFKVFKLLKKRDRDVKARVHKIFTRDGEDEPVEIHTDSKHDTHNEPNAPNNSVNTQHIQTSDQYKIKSTKSNRQQNNTDKQDSYQLPTPQLLQDVQNKNPGEYVDMTDDLIKALKEFNINGRIVSCKRGPVVTLFEFQPVNGIKISRIISLMDDIARAAGVKSVRIVPMQEKKTIGIELPNKVRQFMSFKTLVESREFNEEKTKKIPIVLGVDIVGRPVVADITKMPHLLIGGTTGSGKSVALNCLILSILYKFRPHECRLIMIDPKMLELIVYDNIPHLLMPVVTKVENAVNTLRWAVQEMDRRYDMMSRVSVRNIESFNSKVKESLQDCNPDLLKYKVQSGFDEDNKPIYEEKYINQEELSYIVIVIDEIADLMLTVGKKIDAYIQRLAQLARAAGIHVIMATQRPSTDVVTGTIKANFPARISFKLFSKIDSRTVLGCSGAEQLLGMGDMIFMPQAGEMIRLHGAFASDRDVENVVQWIKSQMPADYIKIDKDKDGSEHGLQKPNHEFGMSEDDLGDDSELYSQAYEIVVKERKASISYLQRKLRIGYNKAARLIEILEERGVVSAQDQSGRRNIITGDQ